MDKIKQAIKCSTCLQILQTPVFLPCSHSICKKHIDETNSRDKFRCAKCGLDHEIPANGFSLNEALCEIIEAQIGSIDLGSVHKDAVESVVNLNRMIEDVDHLINDPSQYIYEEISRLKNEVHMKNEELKLIIDEETDALLNKLNQYQEQSKSWLKSELYSSEKMKLESKKDSYSANSATCKIKLNEVRFDENKWKKISSVCNEAIKQLENSIQSFKEDILMKEFKKYKIEVNSFKRINIEELFDYKILSQNKYLNSTVNNMNYSTYWTKIKHSKDYLK